MKMPGKKTIWGTLAALVLLGTLKMCGVQQEQPEEPARVGIEVMSW